MEAGVEGGVVEIIVQGALAWLADITLECALHSSTYPIITSIEQH